MKNLTRALALALTLLTLCCTSSLALALVEPQSKTIEQSTSYDLDTLKIQIDQWYYAFKKHNMRFYVAHIYTTHPTQLLTAFAGDAYSKKKVETPSEISARHDAVIAINGDYYNYKDDFGLIIRNGMLYRDAGSTRDHLIFYTDGRMEGIYAADYKRGQGQTYIDAGVVQSFAFGPLLVDNGQATNLPEKYFIYTADTIYEPRTAIGMVEPNHYVIVVADGRREGWSDKGMTLQHLQQVFVEQGCQIAYNLDGGGSTSLVVNGEKINRTGGSTEREVSDILYFIP